MKFASFAALLAGCVVLVAAQDNSLAAVEAAFRNAKVSPLEATTWNHRLNVLPDPRRPAHQL